MRLQGQTALVTGASRGIGRAIAGALAREGARLMIASRSAAVRQAARELALETEVHAVRADVSRPADVGRLFAAARKRLGSLDILINSAGMAESRPAAETTDELWNETLGGNLTSVFLCTRAALEWMLPARRGHILNVLSVAAVTTFPGNSAYCAAKAGALAFTRVVRDEVRAGGVRVTALLPGPTDTNLWNRLWPEAPRDKMMSPHEVAQAALAAILMPDSSTMEEILLRAISGNL